MKSFFFFICLFLSVNLYSKHVIVDIAHITDLEPFIEADTLLIFDVGNTLIEGGTCWGHSQSIVTAIEESKARGEDPEEFLKGFAPYWIEAQKFCPGQLIEGELVPLIRRLQERGIKIMGLTHRPVETAASTLDQLFSVGIDFEKSAPYPDQIDLPFVPKARYLEGVIFSTYYNNKGTVLQEFLAYTGLLPTKIVVVDDRSDKLEDVVLTLSNLGLYVVGLHYLYPEQKPYPWDPATSTIQRRLQGSFLNDREAAALLEFTP